MPKILERDMKCIKSSQNLCGGFFMSRSKKNGSFVQNVFVFQHNIFVQTKKEFKLCSCQKRLFETIRIVQREQKSQRTCFEQNIHIYLADAFRSNLAFFI